MAHNGDYRSPTARHITGDRHADSAVHFPLPPPEKVIIASELAGLRQALAHLHAPERELLDAAVQDAFAECKKPSPDKARMAEVICRVIKLSKSASDFREGAGKILPRIAAIASWLGRYGPPLLKEAGLSA